jgi:hypothetical protein
VPSSFVRKERPTLNRYYIWNTWGAEITAHHTDQHEYTIKLKTPPANKHKKSITNIEIALLITVTTYMVKKSPQCKVLLINLCEIFS